MQLPTSIGVGYRKRGIQCGRRASENAVSELYHTVADLEGIQLTLVVLVVKMNETDPANRAVEILLCVYPACG
jgi:hypothetical protein